MNVIKFQAITDAFLFKPGRVLSIENLTQQIPYVLLWSHLIQVGCRQTSTKTVNFTIVYFINEYIWYDGYNIVVQYILRSIIIFIAHSFCVNNTPTQWKIQICTWQPYLYFLICATYISFLFGRRIFFLIYANKF